MKGRRRLLQVLEQVVEQLEALDHVAVPEGIELYRWLVVPADASEMIEVAVPPPLAVWDEGDPFGSVAPPAVTVEIDTVPVVQLVRVSIAPAVSYWCGWNEDERVAVVWIGR